MHDISLMVMNILLEESSTIFTINSIGMLKVTMKHPRALYFEAPEERLQGETGGNTFLKMGTEIWNYDSQGCVHSERFLPRQQGLRAGS
jgi:hypothetical protein